MQHYQNRHMRQIEHAAKQWEARQSKVNNNTLRRKWLQDQTMHNYRVEYDRIRSELAHGLHSLPFRTKYKLEHRAEELKKLFSSGNV
jgi:uncharacterized protein (DUF1919 family)